MHCISKNFMALLNGALVGVAIIIVYVLRPPSFAMAGTESHDRDCRTGWLLVEVDFSSTIQEKKRLRYGNFMLNFLIYFMCTCIQIEYHTSQFLQCNV